MHSKLVKNARPSHPTLRKVQRNKPSTCPSLRANNVQTPTYGTPSKDVEVAFDYLRFQGALRSATSPLRYYENKSRAMCITFFLKT